MIKNPSNMDMSDFPRYYTGDPEAAHLDSSNRETDEWQFDGVTADDISMQFETTPPLQSEHDRTDSGADTLGLSCREVGEWQYIHPDAAAATRKLYEDCAGGLLHPGHAPAMSTLQEELSKWLPAT